MVDAVGTTHHVKINGEHFLIRPGTYRKRPAPLFGARFTTGDPDYNNLSLWQHWVQSCWVGGFGAEVWRDDAMFDEGSGINSLTHEVMTLSRDLGPTGATRTTGKWDMDGRKYERRFAIFNGKLYCLDFGTAPGEATAPGRLYRYNDSTATWTHLYTFADVVRTMEGVYGYLVFGDGGPTMVRMSTAEAFSTFNKPSGRTEIPYDMKGYRGRLYVGFGPYLYRLKSDFTWDGSTAFYHAVGTNYMRHMEVHLGMLYIMSENGHLLRTDGNSTFDIWQFKGGTNMARSGMASFDGRLFVSAADTTDGTNTEEAYIWQFTGSAITELKRWGEAGKDITTGLLRMIGDRLFFGASSLLGMGSAGGFGIACYDPREDAYHIFASNHDQVTYPPGTEAMYHAVDDVIYHRGWVYCTVRGYGIFRTPLSFKDATRFLATYDTTPSGASVGGKNGGWYTSSDFDAGTPGLLKLWNAITIHADLPTTACTVYVEVSNDGGITWYSAGGSVAAATVSKTGSATRYSKTIKLQDTGVTGQGFRATRLKYRITLRTTDTTRSPQLRGVVVRYLPIPEPNWQWDFQVVLSESQELLNHTLDDPQIQELTEVTLEAKIAALENAFRTQQLVNFVDIDGSEWTVGGGAGALITNLVQDVPAPGPHSDGPTERFIQVSLLEAVEAY